MESGWGVSRIYECAAEGAGWGDSTARKHRGGRRAEDFGRGCGRSWTLRRVSQRGAGGLESDKTRNAGCHEVWGYASAAFGWDAGWGAATVDVLLRRGD